MIPLLPVLVAGTGIVAGKKLSKQLMARESMVTKLRRLDQHRTEPVTIAQQLDHHYQRFFQTKIDPLFGSKSRTAQAQEFNSHYNPAEADLNRRLGWALTNTKLAILGATVYQPLSWVSGASTLFIMLPLMRRWLNILWREKRLKYRLVAILSVLGGILGGYYVTSCLMMLVVFVAFKLSARTEASSKAALLGAFALHPPATVWIQQAAGIETQIAFERLQIGDIVVLQAGESVPIDGVIVEGMSTVDQHALTGESQPAEKSVGDNVLANTVVLTGKLYVRVEQTGNDTAAAQIGKMLSTMEHHKLEHEARSERLADRLSFPVLAASGLALATVGPAGAVAILNSGFGSVMLIAGSLSILSHLNWASNQGILVKDGRALEKLAEVDTVVFDKTGTLTLEQPELAQIHGYGEWSEEAVLAFAALAEHRQTHPIAKAILAAAAQRQLDTAVPDEAAYSVGFGVQVQYNGDMIQVGSQRFMQQAGIVMPATLAVVQTAAQASGNSLVFVAVNAQLAGVLELQAQLRPDTHTLVTHLHQRGLKLCILSGDQLQPTQHLAQRLGIDDVFAEVLPEGKADKIRQLQDAGSTVCFVGDGINDTIALQQADVSISLRGATSVATDSAQIILMNQSLQQLDQLFEIAARFHHNLEQTMRMAYIPGAMLIAGVFLLHFGMTAALILYSGGITTAMVNALAPLRAQRKPTILPHMGVETTKVMQ